MTPALTETAISSLPLARLQGKELFRARFQRALRSCVRRRFSVAECFGVIWLETLEEVSLNDLEQSELYDELILWAKQRLFPELIHSPASEPRTGRPGARTRNTLRRS